MIPLLQQLNRLIAEPAHVECPRCRGRTETYTFDRERPCGRCNAKGVVPAAQMAELAKGERS